MGGNETTKLVHTLPREVEIKATFSKEGSVASRHEEGEDANTFVVIRALIG